MMKETNYEIIAPTSVVKATLVCVHGMQEHRGRYLSFANALAKENIAVLIYDLPGHGKGSKGSMGFFASHNGDQVMVDSIDSMLKKMEEVYPDVPHFLFGHSMGSILTRLYLQQNDQLNGVILCGAPNYQAAAHFGKVLANILIALQGERKSAPILTELTLGPFSKAVPNSTCNLDWLSYSKTNIENYLQDSLCGVPFTNVGYRDLYTMITRLHQPYNSTNKNLPILFISGQDDPCTGGAKGLADSIHTLEKSQYCNIKNIIYPKMRHEILNEDDRQIVIDDILDFILKNLAAQSQ